MATRVGLQTSEVSWLAEDADGLRQQHCTLRHQEGFDRQTECRPPVVYSDIQAPGEDTDTQGRIGPSRPELEGALLNGGWHVVVSDTVCSQHVEENLGCSGHSVNQIPVDLWKAIAHELSYYCLLTNLLTSIDPSYGPAVGTAKPEQGKHSLCSDGACI